MDVRQLLIDCDPFEGFDVGEYPADFQGWGYGHYLFESLIDLIRPQVIVEVGSWKGMSAIRMAMEVERLNLETKIVCVDTWLGSVEHFNPGKEARPNYNMPRKHGFPTIYYTFLSNVIQSGHASRIVPLPQDSLSAASILKTRGIRPEMVYIDGAHDRASVERDLDLYFDILADDGVVLGDDFLTSHGVMEAVVAFAAKRGAYFCGDLTKFVICKGQRFSPRIDVGVGRSPTDPWGASSETLHWLKSRLPETEWS